MSSYQLEGSPPEYIQMGESYINTVRKKNSLESGPSEIHNTSVIGINAHIFKAHRDLTVNNKIKLMAMSENIPTPERKTPNLPMWPFLHRKTVSKMEAYLFKDEDEGMSIVALAGNEGVGKTTIALSTVKTVSDQYEIVWINTEDRISVENTLKQFSLNKLRWKPEMVQQTDQFLVIAVEQICLEPTLFVFDNATSTRGKALSSASFDLISFIQQTFPSTTRAKVLITTRDSDWDNPVKVVKVDDLDEHECRKYLSSQLANVTDFSKNCDNLSFLCGYLPINLTIAARSIDTYYFRADKSGDQPYTIEKFLEASENQKEKSKNQVENSVVIDYVLGELKLRQGEESVAVIMITFMSFLSPNGIPRKLVLSLVAKGDTEAKSTSSFQEAIVVLTSQSLMQMSICFQYFSVKRSIQDSVRKNLQDSEKMETIADTFSAYFVRILEVINSKTDNYVTYLANAFYACKVLSICLHKPNVQKLFRLTSNLYATLYFPNCIDLKTRYHEYFRGHVSKSINKFGNKPAFKSNVSLFLIRFDLAKTLKHADPKRCLSLLRPLVKQLEVGKLETNFDFRVRHLHAYCLQKLGKYADSKKIYDQLMQLHKSYTGRGVVEKLETQYGIGVLYISIGKYKDALECFECIHKDTLKHDYVVITIKSRRRIAECKKLLGDYNDALNIFSRIEDESYDQEHFFAITIQFEKADILLKKKCFKKAGTMLKNVFYEQNKLLGHDHLTTLITCCRLAHYYLECGEYHTAITRLQNTLELQKIKLGECHPSTLATAYLVGEAYKRVGKLEEALKVFNTVYLGRVSALTFSHPETLDVLVKLGEVHMELNEFDEARSCFDKVLTQKQISFANENLDVIFLQTRIGLTHLLEGEFRESYKKAINYFTDLRNYCSTCPYKSNEIILTANLYFYIALRQQTIMYGHPFYLDPVVKELKNLSAEAKINLDRNHPFVLQIEYEIGITMSVIGFDKEAKAKLENVLNSQKLVLGPTHLDTLKTQHKLGLVLQKLNELASADELFKEVWKQRTNILGSDHKLTLEAETQLSEVNQLQLAKTG